jgi:hypothetical protein
MKKKLFQITTSSGKKMFTRASKASVAIAKVEANLNAHYKHSSWNKPQIVAFEILNGVFCL